MYPNLHPSMYEKIMHYIQQYVFGISIRPQKWSIVSTKHKYFYTPHMVSCLHFSFEITMKMSSEIITAPLVVAEIVGVVLGDGLQQLMYHSDLYTKI